MDLTKEAVRLAKMGFYVFPLWRAIDGHCEAPWPHECKAIAKHSRVKWKREASRDPGRAWSWWGMWPEAGIGIATGPSNLAVLDVDPKNGGLESFQNLCTQIPRLDEDVPKVQTGSGGFHLYFSQPEHGEVRNTEGKRNGIAPGIDTRGIGGFVVAPPSIHANGKPYQWERELRFPLEPFPDELVQLLGQHSKQDTVKRTQLATPLCQMAEDLIPEGTRNGAFASYAGKLRVAGMDPEELFLFLRWLRDQHCENPETFTDAEISSIIRQSYTYERIAWPAYVKYWLRSGLTGQDLKYLSSLAVLQGENITNPAISTIHKLSGMPKSTQLHCRKHCEDIGLIKSIPGSQGHAAQITLLPPTLGSPRNVPIIKTWYEEREDCSFLSEEKIGTSEGSRLQTAPAAEEERPKATVTDLFLRPRKRQSKRRKPNLPNALSATG